MPSTYKIGGTLGDYNYRPGEYAERDFFPMAMGNGRGVCQPSLTGGGSMTAQRAWN